MLALVAVLGFSSGILCRSFFSVPWQVLALLLLLALLAGGAGVLARRAMHARAALFLACLSLGVLRVAAMPQALPPAYVPLVDADVLLEGTVSREPDMRETSQRVPIAVSYGGSETTVLAVLPLYPELEYGDRVRLSGTLAYPEPFETDTGRTFRYDRFLAKDGIFALVMQAHAEQVESASRPDHRLMAALIRLKHAFQDALAASIPEPGASLASGLLTGGKQGLGEALLDAFVIAGLVHIVVLSGYNVMIIAEAVLRVLGFLPKRVAACIAGIVIGLFVLMAGAGSASIRAGLMAGLALVARATGRTYAVVRALVGVAFLMLLHNPLLLAYDPGFQLSFIATLGLILLHPILERWLGWVRIPMLRDVLASTLAAQAAVLPLLLYQTGILSLIALPANVLVLPAVPFAMLLSAGAGALSLALPALAPVFGFPAHVLLSYIIGAARIAADVPLASVSVPPFPFSAAAATYAALGYLLHRANAPERGAPGRS